MGNAIKTYKLLTYRQAKEQVATAKEQVQRAQTNLGYATTLQPVRWQLRSLQEKQMFLKCRSNMHLSLQRSTTRPSAMHWRSQFQMIM